MPATKRLVLDLPEATVDMIEARVSAGDFTDAPAMIASAVAQMEDTTTRRPPDFSPAEWDGFTASVRETVRRLDAGLERTFSVDEVRDYLQQRREARAEGQAH